MPNSWHHAFSSAMSTRSIITSSVPYWRLSSIRSLFEGAAPTQSLSGIISERSNLSSSSILSVIRMTHYRTLRWHPLSPIFSWAQMWSIERILRDSRNIPRATLGCEEDSRGPCLPQGGEVDSKTDTRRRDRGHHSQRQGAGHTRIWRNRDLSGEDGPRFRHARIRLF